ncbi:MAG: hypothetical protein ABSE62_09365 [Chthoniobacteraceae bacterium]|jgi:hypothetical protein
MKKLLAISIALLACQAVWAGNSTTKKAAASSASDAYTLQKKSYFGGTGNDHNPFWPIGWVKMADASADDAAPAVPHADDFIVTTILLNEPRLAIINGKEMAEGEIAELPFDGGTVMVQCMAIEDGRVIIRWENQNMVVQLHRDEELSATDTVAGQVP